MPEIEVVEQRNHAVEITKIAATMKGGSELAMSAIQRGLTVEQFQAEAIRHLATQPVPDASIGLTRDEARRFSFVRALNALEI